MTLREAEERTGVDIRMRKWDLRAISGKVSLALANKSDPSYAAVMLWDGSPRALTFQLIRSAAGEFKFDALAPGDYCLQAVGGSMKETGAFIMTNVVVKDSDITGLELTVRPSASISGRVLIDQLSTNGAKTCSQTPEPAIEEALISVYPDGPPPVDTQRKCQGPSSITALMASLGANGIARATPDARGEVLIRDMAPGRYRIEVEPPNDDYYLKAITAPQPRSNQPADLGRGGIEIKSGGQVSGIAITMAPGAASVSGSVVSPQPSAQLPPGLIVLLIPAEADSADDVVRFAASPVTSGGAFTFKNVAPGRYFLTVRPEQVGPEFNSAMKRLWWDPKTRALLRREADKQNVRVDLRLCERLENRVLVYRGG